MPWNPFQRGAEPSAAPSPPKPEPPAPAAVRPRLYVWAESPERRHQVEQLFAKDHWTILPTFQSGDDLVKLVRASKPAGVVFHYREGLEGVIDSLQLLERECPECPRLVVCDPACQETLRAAKGIPPVLLSEGSPPQEVEDKLRRAMALTRWLEQPTIRKVLPRLRTIPALPAAHQRVVEALRDPDFLVDDVARLVGRDLALATNLFKAANSAAFGLSQPVYSIAEAIAVLGVRRLQALVLSAWAFSFIDERTCAGFDPAREWEHATNVAVAAKELTEQLGLDAARSEMAVTAAMLHDIGKLLLAANAPEAYTLILADAKDGTEPLWRVEQADMGFSHAEIGACMLAIWGMSPAIIDATAWHHQPGLAPNQGLSPLTIVHLADCRVRQLEPDPAQLKLAGLAG